MNPYQYNESKIIITQVKFENMLECWYIKFLKVGEKMKLACVFYFQVT
ncbi:MAG: hypothetical protein ACTSXU_04570 [Promethearchaeota archaeon]